MGHREKVVVGVQPREKGVEGGEGAGEVWSVGGKERRMGSGTWILWGWHNFCPVIIFILQTALNTVNFFYMLYQTPSRVQ